LDQRFQRHERAEQLLKLKKLDGSVIKGSVTATPGKKVSITATKQRPKSANYESASLVHAFAAEAESAAVPSASTSFDDMAIEEGVETANFSSSPGAANKKKRLSKGLFGSVKMRYMTHSEPPQPLSHESSDSKVGIPAEKTNRADSPTGDPTPSLKPDAASEGSGPLKSSGSGIVFSPIINRAARGMRRRPKLMDFVKMTDSGDEHPSGRPVSSTGAVATAPIVVPSPKIELEAEQQIKKKDRRRRTRSLDFGPRSPVASTMDNLIHELIDTEETYINGLQTLKLMEMLAREEKVLDEAMIKKVFYTHFDILIELHEEFLNKLVTQSSDSILDTFKSFVPMLRVSFSSLSPSLSR